MNNDIKTIVVGFNKTLDDMEISLSNKNINREDLKNDIEVLRGLVEVLDNNNLDITPVTVESKIDRYGIGALVVNLNTNGFSLDEIAEECSKECGAKFTSKEIQTWIDSYVSLPSSKKARALRGSIFDSRNRLEELSILLYALLEQVNNRPDEVNRYTKVSKEEVHLAVIKEMRQLTKQATELIEKIDERNRIQEFQNTVIECLQREAPLVASKVIKSLREQQAIQQLAGL